MIGLLIFLCSRRRFGEHQAETWWSENREKVYEKYNVRVSEKSTASQTHRDRDDEEEEEDITHNQQ